MRDDDSPSAGGPARVRDGFGGPLPGLLLLALYLLLILTSIRHKAPGFDEPAHVVGGLSYWTTGDFRLQPENGVLPQRWCALPLLATGVALPRQDQPAWWNSELWEMAHQLLYAGGPSAESRLFLPRVMIALLGVVLCALVWRWAHGLFGRAGGLVALTLAVFNPALLAHGGLATSDMAAALGLTLAVWAFWRLLHRPTVGLLLASALAAAALFVSKMSAPILVPMMVLMVVARLACPWHWALAWRGRRVELGGTRRWLFLAGVALAHIVVIVAVIWASYGFRFEMFRHAEPGRDRPSVAWATLDSVPGVVPRVAALARRGRLLPEPYLYGLSFMARGSQGRSAFLNGQWSATGWRGFFPYAFLVKTPLALFLLLALAGWGAWKVTREEPDDDPLPWPLPYELLPLGILIVVYGGAAVASHLNIGHRHILPIYPALFVLAGGAATWLQARHRRMRSVVLAGLALYAVESTLSWPNYLAYFNGLSGGPRQAWRHLVDSSLDWGQDLPALKRWLDRNAPAGPGRPVVYLSYFGSADPSFYDLNVEQLPGYLDTWRPHTLGPLTPGLYCISATMLQAVYLPVAQGAWTEAYEREWQAVRPEYGRFEAAFGGTDTAVQRRLLAEKDAAAWNAICWRYENLRLGRLCAWLRGRTPDAAVGYSILIYRLTEPDLRRALEGGP